MTPEDEAEIRDTRSFDQAWMDANEAGRKRLEARITELEKLLTEASDSIKWFLEEVPADAPRLSKGCRKFAHDVVHRIQQQKDRDLAHFSPLIAAELAPLLERVTQLERLLNEAWNRIAGNSHARIAELESQLAAANAEIEQLRKKLSLDETLNVQFDGSGPVFQVAVESETRVAWYCTINAIEQTLSKALGYPWFKDDPENFPDATEADGVCVGEHSPESLAMEAAEKIAELEQRLAAAEAIIAFDHNDVLKLGAVEFNREIGTEGWTVENIRTGELLANSGEEERLYATWYDAYLAAVSTGWIAAEQPQPKEGG